MGYRASKVFNGKKMFMTIKEGSDGPLFSVKYFTQKRTSGKNDNPTNGKDGDNTLEYGEVEYEGTSPTHPWTEC